MSDPTASVLTNLASGPWPKIAGLLAAAVMAYGTLKTNSEELRGRMASVEVDVKTLQRLEAARDADVAGLRGDIKALSDQNRTNFDWLKRELDQRGGRR